MRFWLLRHSLRTTGRMKPHKSPRVWIWIVPTVLRDGRFRIYFFSHDIVEPPHVHVDRDDCSAKFWLDPVGLAVNLGFTPRELRRIRFLIVEHRAALLEAWDGYPRSQSG